MKNRGMRLMALSLLLLVSCASGTTYLDPENPSGAPGWGAYEVRRASTDLVTELYRYLTEKDTPALLAFKPIRNRTTEHIETEMLADQIRASLIAKKIYFVQLGLRGEILKEMELGQSGLIDDSAIPIGHLKSPNYYLEGVITDAVNQNNGNSIQYIIVTLSLTSAQTGVTEWVGTKEFLKSTRSDVIGW